MNASAVPHTSSGGRDGEHGRVLLPCAVLWLQLVARLGSQVGEVMGMERSASIEGCELRWDSVGEMVLRLSRY